MWPCSRKQPHTWTCNRGVDAWRPPEAYPLKLWITHEGLVTASERNRHEGLFRGVARWLDARLDFGSFTVEPMIAAPGGAREAVRVALEAGAARPKTTLYFDKAARGRITGAVVFWPVHRYDLEKAGEALLARYAAAHELLHAVGAGHAPRGSNSIMAPKLKLGTGYGISDALARRIAEAVRTEP